MKSIHGERLFALDGVRGVAIILVVLSHIDTHTFSTWVPFFMREILFVSGGIGVGLLFVLSGFLMAFLYSRPASTFSFLQKRYTRIFPVFLVVSIGLVVSQLLHQYAWSKIGIILGLAALVHLFWVYVIKKLTDRTKRKLFGGFLALQLVVAVMYALASQNNIALDAATIGDTLYVLLTGLTSSTLTFFVGDSFPKLQPVYWSLASEVIFYILYPVVCAPIIAYLSPKSRVIKVGFLMALVVFFVGATRVLVRIDALSALRPDFFIYFVGGMGVGYVYGKHGTKMASLKASVIKLASFCGIGAVIVLLVLGHIDMRVLNSVYRPVLLTIPYALIILTLLMRGTVLRQIFEAKVLVYIGTISYSIYISHIWLSDVAIKILGQPKTDFQTIIYIVIVSALLLAVASALYVLMERPYFIRANVKKEAGTRVSYRADKNALIVCVCMCVIYLGIMSVAYKTNLTYVHIPDAHLRSVVAASSHTKEEATFLANERVLVVAEKNKTLLMLLPFLIVTLYLIYQSMRESTGQNIYALRVEDDDYRRGGSNKRPVVGESEAG